MIVGTSTQGLRSQEEKTASEIVVCIARSHSPQAEVGLSKLETAHRVVSVNSCEFVDRSPRGPNKRSTKSREQTRTKTDPESDFLTRSRGLEMNKTVFIATLMNRYWVN